MQKSYLTDVLLQPVMEFFDQIILDQWSSKTVLGSFLCEDDKWEQQNDQLSFTLFLPFTAIAAMTWVLTLWH